MLKRIFQIISLGLLTVALIVAGCNILIYNKTKNQLYDEMEKLPYNNVGLVLGTSKYFSNGRGNLFFKYRMEATALLFKAGKIKHVIVSGDNHVMEYNEAVDMQKALLKLGIPDSCITLDYAGFRTLDSVIRCKKVFGQNKFTIISQKFHNQRALFIGNYYDIESVGFNAQEVPEGISVKTYIREYFAKFKAVLDLYILHQEPKFLGNPVEIKVD